MIPHCKCGSYVLGTMKKKWEQNHVALLSCPPCTHEAHSSMSTLGCTGPPPRGGLRHPPSPRHVGLGRTGPRPAHHDGCGGLNCLPPHHVGLARTCLLLVGLGCTCLPPPLCVGLDRTGLRPAHRGGWVTLLLIITLGWLALLHCLVALGRVALTLLLVIVISPLWLLVVLPLLLLVILPLPAGLAPPACPPCRLAHHLGGGHPVAVIGWDWLVVVVGWGSLALVFGRGIHHHWGGFAGVGHRWV